MNDLTGPVVGLVILLALSGFFSSAETALMAVSRHRIRHLERRGNRRAAIVRVLTDSPDRLLSAVLLGNNFVNIAASALATAVAIRTAGDNGIVFATLGMTALILIFSEIAPKTIAARDPERLALMFALPIRLVVLLLHPFANACAAIAGFLIRPFVDPARRPKVSEEEIRSMIELGEEERVIEREKHRMLAGVFQLTKTTIADVMIPRTSVHGVALDATPEELIDAIRGSGATRLPVYRGSLDDVVGILHSKDVFGYWDRMGEIDIPALMRKPFYVPETATLETLLRLFRHHGQHLALVVDEFGGVEGIVTLEDLLEEIVGDIQDEHDSPPPRQLVELEDGALLAEGSCPLGLLSSRYRLDAGGSDASTLAGFLMEISGEVPQPGTRLTWGAVTFNVRRASRNRVDLVRIEGLEARR